MKKLTKKNKIILSSIALALIVIAIVISVILLNKNKKNPLNNTSKKDDNQSVEVKKVKIVNEDSTSRPFAVMINNISVARPLQSGLQDAYLMYEIIVEGRISRYLALFIDQSTERIGSIRSARHYFLDYALENDAIYVHYGWSPQAQYDISNLGVNNINGISESESSFWRVKDKRAPHNVATSTAKILSIAERKGYKTTSTKKSVLNYVTDEVELTDGQNAEKITIPYSYSNDVEYTYDATTKRYQRYSKGVKETDWSTGENITTKNIIITFAKNSVLNDGENKDRQTLSNVGTLNGYYITNGKAIKITCEKTSRSAQTVYKDLDGNEIKVNDGNTYVQICPINAKVTIEGAEETVTEDVD